MSSLLKWARTLGRLTPLAPLRFPTAGFKVVPKSEILEEEQFQDAISAGQYYPVNIGDIYAEKYQILGKLGFGTTSTVWLARNLQLGEHHYVALKVYTRNMGHRDEFQIYDYIRRVGNQSHPGYPHIRTAWDIFTIPSPRVPAGSDETTEHYCLVQKPMWATWKALIRRNPAGRFNVALLKAGLQQVLLALDFLHTQCHLVHTDIKSDNILQEIADGRILAWFADLEMAGPSPRKLVDGYTIYRSRPFELPEFFGDAVLGNLGSAVRGDEKRNHDAQPDVYRSPETMLNIDWSYPVDIWNLGCMIWDLFEGRHLFYGQDPDGKGYSTRAHLAEVIALLGPPPLDLVKRGVRSDEFFTEEGQWRSEVVVPKPTTLEENEFFLEGEDKEMFISLVRGMLQWRPEDRKTAKELLQDPWLNSP
ncbi:hypothetical protein KVR01_013665 [Diaporthe batatas]|uniref:uncharacterized protein n=1 Tax=Diaporthe batatas TaxID=748121 RepID=UPI001D043207|nr:uncharacterized protein KVR01_013665 [Diaporthe batatas]KAG8156431.1 hypothetical protein KVR01_013665 [Diaporthe batatas]